MQENGTSPQLNVGRFLRTARKRADLTQAELAQQLGLASGQSISNIERGVVPFPGDHIKGITDALGLDQVELVNRLLEVQKQKLMGVG
jgi:transcriptional regulator with XRE-family HTH domain